MTYSDDYAPSTSSSFSGDQTGDIFATPDTVPQSPVTSARIVDTQSGYMVVIKRADERLALSVKRRIGTPPQSHVLLTADESLQLSHVLDDSAKSLSSRGEYFMNTNSAQGGANHGRRLSRHARKAANEAQSLDTADSASSQEASENSEGPDWDELSQPSRKRKSRKKQHDDHLDNLTEAEDYSFLERPPMSGKQKLMKFGAIGIAVAFVVFIVVPTFMMPSKWLSAAPPAPQDAQLEAQADKANAPNAGGEQSVADATAAPPELDPADTNTISDASNPLNTDAVDKFTRIYAKNLLNFSPKVYRRSQVLAMAVMSPALMDKYWTETNFPVGTKDLPSAQKDVKIKKVLQRKPVNGKQLTVQVYGRLKTVGQQESTPIALKLTVGVNSDGQLRVAEQTDLSSKK